MTDDVTPPKTPFHSFDTMEPIHRQQILVGQLNFAAPRQMVSVNGQALSAVVASKAGYDVVVMRAVAAHMDWRWVKTHGADPREIENYERILEQRIIDLARAGSAAWGLKLE